MKYLKKKYAELLAWAGDSEIILLARSFLALGVGLLVDTLSGLNVTAIAYGEINWKSAVFVAGFGAFLEFLRKYRAEDV